MARRRAARRRARGGGGIPAPRADRARVGAAAGALAGAAAVAVAAALTAGEPLAAAIPGGYGVLLLALALWRSWTGLVVWAVALLGAAYALALAVGAERATIDAAAPLVAAALLLVAELAYWSLELRDPGRWEGRLVTRRLGLLGVLVVVSLALGSVVVVFTSVPAGGGVGLTFLGVAAAVATLGILAGLARRTA